MSTFPDLPSLQLQGWRKRGPFTGEQRWIVAEPWLLQEWGCPGAPHSAWDCQEYRQKMEQEINVLLPGLETTIKSVVPHQSLALTE